MGEHLSEAYHERDYMDFPSESFVAFAQDTSSPLELQKMLKVIDGRIYNDPWNEDLTRVRISIVENIERIEKKLFSSEAEQTFWKIIANSTDSASPHN
jgi:hypothetical protein